jgi:hypothetical protein
LKGASSKQHLKAQLRHVAYAAGWKKFEPLWDWVIRAKRVAVLLPVLEAVLTGFGNHPPRTASNPDTAGQVIETDHLPAGSRLGSQLSH